MKKFICLFVYLFIIQLFLSCEKELYEDNIQNSSRNLKRSHKPFKELLLLDNFNKAYSKLKTEKQKSAAMRTAIEEEYNFTISENADVKIVEVDNKTFYNILIERDTVTAEHFENLLLLVEKINNIDEVSAYIVRYMPGFYANTTTYNFEDAGNKELTTLFSRISSICNTVCTTLCWDCDPKYLHEYTLPHPPNSVLCTNNSFIFTTCETICTTGSGGGNPVVTPEPGGNTGGGGGTTGGTTTGGGTPPPNNNGAPSPPPELLLDPVVDEENETLPKRKPCKELNDMVNSPVAESDPAKTVLSNLTDLKNNVTTNKERMYVMTPQTFMGNVYHNSLLEHYAESAVGGDGVSINVGNVPIDVIMHTHWDTEKHLSVFSLEDMYQIYKSIINGNISAENVANFASIVITAHGTQYAFKISNLETFKTWGDTFFAGWDFPNQVMRNAYKKAKVDKFYEDTKIGLGNTPDQIAKNEKGWAAFMNSQGVGLELYKADNTFTQWTKLTTNALGTYKEIPCVN